MKYDVGLETMISVRADSEDEARELAKQKFMEMLNNNDFHMIFLTDPLRKHWRGEQ